MADLFLRVKLHIEVIDYKTLTCIQPFVITDCKQNQR